ncbi:MAG: hypothetical protein NUV98_03605 [Candidatus Roizmanbacteria bacterium]|nr:hypothetical protein [Candidatus Roizmanbacteria bacterium]
MKLRDLKNTHDRRSFIEKETKTKLENLGNFRFDEKIVSSKNCENLIGAVHIPLGIAGPLKIEGMKHRITDYYIPLATTEGALVASVNRGCKAITESGGATVIVESVGTTRGPVFETAGIVESMQFKEWLDSNFKFLQDAAKKTSSHLTLKKLGARMAGKFVYVRFYFDTTDAMGMNMVTIATQVLAQAIEK